MTQIKFATVRVHQEIEVSIVGAPDLDVYPSMRARPYVALLEYDWAPQRGWLFTRGRVTGHRVLASGARSSKQVFGHPLKPGNIHPWMQDMIDRYRPRTHPWALAP